MSSEYNSNYGSNDNVGDLQYDDSAFWYYSLAVVSVILLCVAIHIVRAYLRSLQQQNTSVDIPDTPHFQKKLEAILSKRTFGGSMFKKLLLLAAVVWVWSTCLSKSLENKDFKSFDPFALLEVDSSATEKEIKKSYRRLVKLYHPDLNPGDREAYNMFLQVTKAYQCLTDPETKETCAKFGNPDGNASFEVGVAIPSFFLKQENTKLVLSLFFIFLFLGTLVYLISLNSSDDLNKYGVSQKTLKNCFHFFKNENMIFKNVVEMMSISEELRPIIMVRKDQMKDMLRIANPGVKTTLSKNEFHFFKKLIFIIYYHMENDEPIPGSLKKDLAFIQEKSIGLLVSLFEMGFELVQLSKQYVQMWEKPLSPRVLQTLCTFSQHFVQGMSLHESPLLQLPFVDRTNVKRIANKLKLKSFSDLLSEKSESREKLLGMVADSEQKKRELKDALDCFTQFEVDIDCFIDLGDGEKDRVIRQGDIFTIEIEIKRVNRHVGYIYSKKLDFLKLERLSTLLYIKKTKWILHFETKFTKEKTHKVTIKGDLPLAGEFDLVLLVESDSYVGVSLQKEFKMKVEPPSKQEDYDIHPDDREALSKPSFLMSLINNALEDADNSDDEYEDEEEEEGQSLNKASDSADEQEKGRKADENEEEIKETKDS